MTKKIDLYAKFIQNEQKRLKNSTVVASRYLSEAQTTPGAGAPGPTSGGGARSGMGGLPLKPRYTIRDGKIVPKEPTVSPSASPTKPKPELKMEPLQVGKAVVGAAGLVGGGAAILSGTEKRKEAEAERAPKQETPVAEPPKKEPPKAEVSPEPSKPEAAAEAPKSSEEDEEAEKYVAPVERRYRSIKKESLERFINVQKPRVPNSSKFPDVFTEQEAVKAQPIKAKPVSDEVKAEPVKSGTELDSELEDMPGTDPKEQGAKFQPVTRSPEYMDYLRQNQEKIIAAKRAREEAGAFKSKIQASSTSADVDSL